MSEMTPANLPDLYARVVAKRPELAVKWHIDERFVLVHRNDQHFIWWTYRRDDGVWCCTTVDDPDAADKILAKWVKALPVRIALVHEAATAWGVDGNGMVYPNRPTPLEALAVLWLGYQP